MQTENQSQIKVITLFAFNQVQGSELRSTPAPYTLSQLLEEKDVKQELEQGYEIESFKDVLNDLYTRQITVFLKHK